MGANAECNLSGSCVLLRKGQEHDRKTMNPILFKILLTVAIQGLKYFRDHYESLSPEQKAELDRATKENFEKAGGMGSGADP